MSKLFIRFLYRLIANHCCDKQLEKILLFELYVCIIIKQYTYIHNPIVKDALRIKNTLIGNCGLPR